MKQNKYDEASFFETYSQMQRSIDGLAAAGEWPAFHALLPDLRGKRVLDLGCGFGWHCRHAVEQGADSVVGVDLSEKMLARARAEHGDPRIEYRRTAIEDIDFGAGEFDVVISSLAFHYVERFDLACARIRHCLARDGAFVFSVEHPIFTSRALQDWCDDADGRRQHWPVDDYQHEGLREARWMNDTVVKYHRTLQTYVNSVIDADFQIARLSEPVPDAEALAKHPDWQDEARRPMFLLISALAI